MDALDVSGCKWVCDNNGLVSKFGYTKNRWFLVVLPFRSLLESFLSGPSNGLRSSFWCSHQSQPFPNWVPEKKEKDKKKKKEKRATPTARSEYPKTSTPHTIHTPSSGAWASQPCAARTTCRAIVAASEQFTSEVGAQNRTPKMLGVSWAPSKKIWLLLEDYLHTFIPSSLYISMETFFVHVPCGLVHWWG